MTFRLSGFQAFRLSGFQAFRLSGFQAFRQKFTFRNRANAKNRPGIRILNPTKPHFQRFLSRYAECVPAGVQSSSILLGVLNNPRRDQWPRFWCCTIQCMDMLKPWLTPWQRVPARYRVRR
ncbi:hypothetical protein C1N72_11700 [Pantoea ananatis]